MQIRRYIPLIMMAIAALTVIGLMLMPPQAHIPGTIAPMTLTDNEPPIITPSGESWRSDPFPPNGSAQWYQRLEAHQGRATLTIDHRDGGPEHIVIRLRDLLGKPVAQVYVRTGHLVRIRLPYGHYMLSEGRGTQWIDSRRQYGSNGRYVQTGIRIERTGAIYRTQNQEYAISIPAEAF